MSEKNKLYQDAKTINKSNQSTYKERERRREREDLPKLEKSAMPRVFRVVFEGFEESELKLRFDLEPEFAERVEELKLNVYVNLNKLGSQSRGDPRGFSNR